MAFNTIDAWKLKKKGTATLVLPSTSVLSARSGTLITLVRNAKAIAHVCGVQGTTSIGIALIFKEETEKTQNVQTAMEHIHRGPRAVQLS